MMLILLFTLSTPVIATENLTDDDYFVNVNAEGAGIRVTFGKGNNERNLVIWSFFEFDDDNEDHIYQETEQKVALYEFGEQYIYSKGKHLSVEEDYLWYRAEWNDGTKLEVRIFIRPPNLEIEITVLKHTMVKEWNDLTIVYEINDKSKHATFEFKAKEVKIVEKLNPNILDRILESLPF